MHVNTVSNGILATDISKDAGVLSADLMCLTRVGAFDVFVVMKLREPGLPIARRVVVVFRISYDFCCYMIFVHFYLLSVGVSNYLPRNLMRFTKSVFFFLGCEIKVLPHKNKLDVKQIFSRFRKIAKSDYLLRHVCPPLRLSLSAWNNLAATVRIFMKCRI